MATPYVTDETGGECGRQVHRVHPAARWHVAEAAEGEGGLRAPGGSARVREQICEILQEQTRAAPGAEPRGPDPRGDPPRAGRARPLPDSPAEPEAQGEAAAAAAAAGPGGGGGAQPDAGEGDAGGAGWPRGPPGPRGLGEGPQAEEPAQETAPGGRAAAAHRGRRHPAAEPRAAGQGGAAAGAAGGAGGAGAGAGALRAGAGRAPDAGRTPGAGDCAAHRAPGD